MKELQNIVKALFKEDKIKSVLGYVTEDYFYNVKPVKISKIEDSEKLTFNPFCVYNLVTYLKKEKDFPLAILVKPCDIRALRVLLLENQLVRSNLFIIGLNCKGIIDKRKITTLFHLEISQIESAEILDRNVKFKFNSGKEILEDIEKCISEKCLVCKDRELEGDCDIVVGEKPAYLPSSEDFLEVKELEALSLEERAEYWNKAFRDCLRCYACIKVCPLCYCENCFVDKTTPQWVAKNYEIGTLRDFHIIRAFHLAGRCIDCGECQRVCPVNIPLRRLNQKLRKILKEEYNYTPGKENEIFWGSFSPGDPDRFL